MSNPSPIRFSLGLLFYVTALISSAIATFGIWGFAAAGAVLCGWCLIIWTMPTGIEVAKMLFLLLCIFLMLSLLVPAASCSRVASEHGQCRNTVKMISLAIMGYAEDHGHLPPPYMADENGKPMHSWRVLILPYLDEQALYDRYDFDEPWDGPHNSKLLSAMPWFYQCPSQSTAPGLCHYTALVGPDTAWPIGQRRTWKDFEDGCSSTVLISESPIPVPWTKPDTLTVSEFMQAIQGDDRTHAFGHAPDNYFTYSVRYFHVCFADGHTEWLSSQWDHATFRAAVSVAGGEGIDRSEFDPPIRVKWGRVISLFVFGILCLLPAFFWLPRAGS